jgi:hypothetical protein
MLRGRATAEGRFSRLARRYRSIAFSGFHGESAIYEELALGIAASRELLSFIDELPLDKRQPQLFLAAVRYRHGVPENVDQLVEIVRRDHAAIRDLILSRTTQTNEPARCAAILPLLARLPQPLAIVEVGASGGLCLLPDRYGYDYGAVRLAPPGEWADIAPVFCCATSGPIPYPTSLPQVAWRRGLDLNPIDVRSEEEVRWLETLVWPGQRDRARLLRAAIEVARRDPPVVQKGDLRSNLAGLLASAPRDATLVVFHSGVLQYVMSQAERNRFVSTVRDTGAVWISNEAHGTFPSFAQNVPPPPTRSHMMLMLDATPLAWTGAHGQSIDWFGPAEPRHSPSV